MPTLSVEADPSKVTNAPSLTDWSGPAWATGGVTSKTVTLAVSEPEFPAASRTVRVTE